MVVPRTKNFLYACLLVGGLVCMAFAVYQYRYTCLVLAGNHAVREQRFDTQDYERASHFWLAQHDTLRFNQGVLAYKARHLPRAAENFRQVVSHTTNPRLRMHAHYNLGMVMLALEEVESAVGFFTEALRLDPNNTEAKFNLERLYHFALRQKTGHGEAALQQAPGAAPGQHEAGDGQGRSRPPAGI